MHGATYYIAKSGSDSNSGKVHSPWLTLSKACQTLIAGDTVLIGHGIYNEPLWPENSGTKSAPICYIASGDGEVIVHATGLGDNTGIFNIKGKGNQGYLKPIGYIRVKGLTFRGSNQFGISINGGEDGSSGRQCFFENVKSDSNNVGTYFTCSDLIVKNSEFRSNTYGGFWVFHGGRNIRISGCSFHNNGTKGNVDGMTLQDCEHILVEDCVAYGQYDGIDIGSQKDEHTGPGCKYIILRRCRAYNNYNGNFPSSTTLKGPLCYQYCTASDNHDWAGGMVMYEAARNTHIWNCTIDRVDIGINLYQGPGPIYLYNNIINADKSVITNEAGGKIVNSNNLLNESESREKIIDKGTFFLNTRGSGKDVSTIKVNKDPGIYFFPGDTIQVQNSGLYTIESLTDSTIIISGRIRSYIDGQGIHSRYSGKAPDIGAYEFINK
jgi:hypothetical protein